MRYLLMLSIIALPWKSLGQSIAADSTSSPKWLYGGNAVFARTNWVSNEVPVEDAGRYTFEGGFCVIKPVTSRFWVGTGVEANTRKSTQLLDAVSTRVYESFIQIPVMAWLHRQLPQSQISPLRTTHTLLGGGLYTASLLKQGFATGTQTSYAVEDRAFDYTKYGVLLDYSLLFLPARKGVQAGHRIGLRTNIDINGLTSSNQGIRTFSKYAGIGLQYSLLFSAN